MFPKSSGLDIAFKLEQKVILPPKGFDETVVELVRPLQGLELEEVGRAPMSAIPILLLVCTEQNNNSVNGGAILVII